jgi:lipid II:glycine glycyltransferase (peptidoglycan interpeptide bridge formation enzyme)
MLKNSDQSDAIFELESIFVQKRRIGLWKSGLFCMWVCKQDITQTFLQQAQDLCKKEKCLFLQIETLDYGNDSDSQIPDWLTEWYYKKFITPHTAIIDLALSKDNILANMKPKWRYNIRLAQKKWVSISFVEKNAENISAYFKLSQETTSRDGFSWQTLAYYETFLREIPGAELIFAKVDSTLVAAGIFVFRDDVSYYYYGASSSDPKYRNMMAPYLVQWWAIEHAKKIESNIYDFLGVSGQGKYFDASLSGVTDFKRKFTAHMPLVSKSYLSIRFPISYIFLKTLRKLKG